MSYNYTVERPKLFTEHGVRLIINSLIGALTQCAVTEGTCTDTITTLDGVGAADGWTCIAAREYLCEIGLLKQVHRHGNTDIYIETDKLRALRK